MRRRWAPVFEAADLGLIEPILVGRWPRSGSVAASIGKDLGSLRLVDAPTAMPPPKAVALVRAGEAEALMKGSLHTDELMAAVVGREGGLRTARRVSHCFVMDVPGHPDALIITDAAVNIAPTLADKVDIVQNAIDLALALKAEPRVAILSAMETVNPEVNSTIEAAALCKMADRGQIKGAILDGPLALDNAIDLGAAKIKNTQSPVAGKANVLVVPDLEAGNMLAKSPTFLAGADAAGIVLGARVPIILTSRADSALTGSPPAPWRRCSPKRSVPSSPSGRSDHGARLCRAQCRLVQPQVPDFRGRGRRRSAAAVSRPGRRHRRPGAALHRQGPGPQGARRRAPRRRQAVRPEEALVQLVAGPASTRTGMGSPPSATGSCMAA
jgi:phosphate acetyltransferase